MAPSQAAGPILILPQTSGCPETTRKLTKIVE